VTDVIMPSMSGLDLARRAVQRRPGLAVVFMSGYTDEDLDRRDLAGLRTHVLRKPFNSRQLLARLNEMLADDLPREE
jgi:CheY-like chemotaxis protein